VGNVLPSRNVEESLKNSWMRIQMRMTSTMSVLRCPQTRLW